MNFLVLLTFLSSIASFASPFNTYLGKTFSVSEGGKEACLVRAKEIETKLNSKNLSNFQVMLSTCIQVSKDEFRISMEYEAHDYLSVLSFDSKTSDLKSCNFSVNFLKEIFQNKDIPIVDSFCESRSKPNSEFNDYKIHMDYVSPLVFSQTVDTFSDLNQYSQESLCFDRILELKNSFALKSMSDITFMCFSSPLTRHDKLTYQVFGYYLHNTEKYVDSKYLETFKSQNICELEKPKAIAGFEVAGFPVVVSSCNTFDSKNFSLNISFIRKSYDWIETYENQSIYSENDCKDYEKNLTTKLNSDGYKVLYSSCASKDTRCMLKVYYTKPYVPKL